MSSEEPSYPAIVNATAILLKERNREMSGVQSIVSYLMYACHSEKQVLYMVGTYFYGLINKHTDFQSASTQILSLLGRWGLSDML